MSSAECFTHHELLSDGILNDLGDLSKARRNFDSVTTSNNTRMRNVLCNNYYGRKDTFLDKSPFQ